MYYLPQSTHHVLRPTCVHVHRSSTYVHVSDSAFCARHQCGPFHAHQRESIITSSQRIAGEPNQLWAAPACLCPLTACHRMRAHRRCSGCLLAPAQGSETVCTGCACRRCRRCNAGGTQLRQDTHGPLRSDASKTMEFIYLGACTRAEWWHLYVSRRYEENSCCLS